jgi:hypothetical protein
VRVAWLGSGVMVMASLRVNASLEVIMEVMSDMLKSRPGAGILKKRGLYTENAVLQMHCPNPGFLDWSDLDLE